MAEPTVDAVLADIWHRGLCTENVHDFERARAAVAELVEADREYDAVKAEHDACAKYDEHGAYVPREMYERMEAVSARRAAALARVGGAS